MLQSLKREVLSGLTVSVVALPLALAFGIQGTGTSDGAIIGLYGAIITGFFAALFGGTPRQVTGPTGPITVIFTGIVAQYGLTYAFIAAFLGGILQIIFGLLKLGNYIKFIPLPVVSGFMNGIAIIIIMSQLKFVSSSFLVVLLTIGLMLLGMRWIKTIPASLLALLLGTVLVIGLEKILPFIHVHLPFIGDFTIFKDAERIGEIPKGLPHFHMPIVEIGILLKLIPAAISIAVLGSIDSLLTSVVMDNMTGTKHKSNKELIGQGIGNAFAGLFGAMPGAGATVRSVINLRSGGRTALSAMIHSAFLLIIMLLFGEWASQIPLAVLAGILIVTGITMFDINSFKVLKAEPRSDALVMLVTMILTVAIDLMVAVAVGVVWSALVFMKKMSEKGFVINQRQHYQWTVYSLKGPFYFGVVDGLLDRIMQDKGKYIALEMDHITLIDASAATSLLQLHQQLGLNSQILYLTGIKGDVRSCLENMKILQVLGEDHIFPTTDDLTLVGADTGKI